MGVYFSADQTITSEDVFAGFACTVSSLAPGEVGTCNGLATVPNLLPGDYYVGLLVDLQNHILESIETNNAVSTGHLTSVAPNPLDPIVNGSFETGDLAGWTVKELTPDVEPQPADQRQGRGRGIPGADVPGVLPTSSDYFTSAPTHGQWAVLHDFNGDDPLTSGFVNRRELYQDVTLPAGTTTLEFDYRAAWELFRFGSTQDRTFRRRDRTGRGRTDPARPDDSRRPEPDPRRRYRQPVGRRGGLPAWQCRPERLRGQSVRLKFVWNIPEPGNGFGFFQLDDIRINANGTPGNTPPVVTLTSPADGSSFVTGTSITFAATANDAEEGDLSANLVWTSSVTGGQIGTGASFSTSALSVGTHTITAYGHGLGQRSGLRLNQPDRDGPNTPPTVTITAPANGSSFVAGTSIAFAGTATDTADGNLSASLSWSSSLDGTIGTGASFSKSTLGVGTAHDHRVGDRFGLCGRLPLDQRDRHADPEYAADRDDHGAGQRRELRSGHLDRVHGNRNRRPRRHPQRQPGLDVQSDHRPDWNGGQLLDHGLERRHAHDHGTATDSAWPVAPVRSA